MTPLNYDAFERASHLIEAMARVGYVKATD